MGGTTKQAATAQERLQAMSHSLRAQLLRMLGERTASPAELSRELGEGIPHVSYHVKRLVELGCAELVKEGTRRGAVEHFYRATEYSLIETDEWDDLDPGVGQSLAAEFFQATLDDAVGAMKAGTVGDDPDCHLSRTPIVLDEPGIKEALALVEATRKEIWEIASQSADRLASGDGAGTSYVSIHALFEGAPSGR